MRFIFLIALAFITANANAAPSQVEDYLNNLQNFSANFAQIDSEGNASSGDFYLQRPGKFRWQYNDQPLLIVSNGSMLTYFDKQLNEITYVPASQTLAGFLARENITLEGDIKLIEHLEKDDFIKTVITQTNKPEEGNLALYFNKSPMLLTMMEVIDQNGSATKLYFTNQDPKTPINPNKFIFQDPNFIKDAWE